MRVALARHDELMREAIKRHNGCVFKTMGDAFCAAFATAPDAAQPLSPVSLLFVSSRGRLPRRLKSELRSIPAQPIAAIATTLARPLTGSPGFLPLATAARSFYHLRQMS